MGDKITEWRPVVGFDALYEVSRIGQVRSLARKTSTGMLGGCEIKPDVTRNGYARVSLSKDGRVFRFSVHRLVLSSFCRLPIGNEEARHIDGDKLNNSISNLAWGSRSENAFDRVRHGTQVDNTGERHGNTHLTDEDAIAIHRRRTCGEPIKAICAEFGVSPATVSRIGNLRGWKHIASMVSTKND